MQKLNAHTLRRTIPTPLEKESVSRNEIYIILEDILDTYNVGAIFRLADAVGAKHIFLCGTTETPPNHRIKKASVNTWEWVSWSYMPSAVKAIRYIKKSVKNISVVGVELDKQSVAYETYDYHMPIALLVGNESSGIKQKTLQAVDAIVEIPMLGINISLNVMVSLAIVLYKVIEKNKLANP